MWSHKPGSAEALAVDSNGVAITNPETCGRDTTTSITIEIAGVPTAVPARVNYDVFCGYFYVKKGGAEVGP
jgi:hypothetical protein